MTKKESQAWKRVADAFAEGNEVEVGLCSQVRETVEDENLRVKMYARIGAIPNSAKATPLSPWYWPPTPAFNKTRRRWALKFARLYKPRKRRS